MPPPPSRPSRKLSSPLPDRTRNRDEAPPRGSGSLSPEVARVNSYPGPAPSRRRNKQAGSRSSRGSPVFSYSETPISSGEIRLFEILDEKQLEVKLVQAELGCGKYSALSYAWGNAEDTVPIICNDATLQINRNLYDLLQELRRKARSGSSSRASNNGRSDSDQSDGEGGEPQLFWTDSICINQQDEKEKSLQVRLMREIYEKASEVLVWLGPSDNDADMAFRILPELVKFDRQKGSLITPKRFDVSQYNWAERANFRVCTQEGYRASQRDIERYMRGFFRLLRRRWFTRVWVIQEYAVARSARVLCGKYEADDNDFTAAFSLLLECRVNTVLKSPWIEPSLLPLCFAKAERKGQSEVPLLGLLKRFQRYHATDPRDKVYALCGLASDVSTDRDWDDDARPGKLNVPPDYEIDTSRMYRKLAKAFLIRDRNLDIIALAGKHTPLVRPSEEGTWERRPDLPSWVPDWGVPDLMNSVQLVEFNASAASSRSLDRTRLPSRLRKALSSSTIQLLEQIMNASDSKVKPAVFRAADNTEYDPKFVMRGRGLKLRGQRLGLIDKLGDVCYGTTQQTFDEDIPENWDEPMPPKEFMDRTNQFLEVVAKWVHMSPANEVGQYEHTDESIVDAYWKTVRGGHVQSTIEERWEFLNWYGLKNEQHAFFNSYYGAAKMNRKDWADFLAAQAYNTPVSCGESDPFMQKAALTMMNRQLFVTDAGHLGLVAAGAEKGDAVVIFEGGNVPFVVRETPDGDGKGHRTWEIIHACYVHGFMYGPRFERESCKAYTIV